MPKVTEDYVPRLLALKDIIQNAPQYKVDLPMMSFITAVRTVYIDTQLDLRFAAKAAGLSLAQLQDYNPALLRDVTSPKTDFHLLIPHQPAKRLQQSLILHLNHSGCAGMLTKLNRVILYHALHVNLV